MRPRRYRFIICGRLSAPCCGVFEDLCVEPDGANTGMTGELDQAALHGVLGRIQVLGLELMELNRLEDAPGLDRSRAC